MPSDAYDEKAEDYFDDIHYQDARDMAEVEGVSAIDRPSWGEYFMSMAFLVAQRSIDSTKHGTVVVSADKTILSVGYNSPPRGCKDEDVPLTRPLKYYYMSHSEVNAIANAARHGVSLMGSTFFVTGFPCASCFRSIINVGAVEIIYGPVSSACIKPDEMQAIQKMNNGIKLIPYCGKIGDTLTRTMRYMKSKCDISLDFKLCSCKEKGEKAHG